MLNQINFEFSIEMHVNLIIETEKIDYFKFPIETHVK